jgi:hypothetical protein
MYKQIGNFDIDIFEDRLRIRSMDDDAEIEIGFGDWNKIVKAIQTDSDGTINKEDYSGKS